MVKGIRWQAHRLVWEKFYGSIPEGLCVMHKCAVPACVRPDHLELGTRADNNRDRAAKGRTARGDRHGFRLHPEKVARGDRNGSRTHPEKVARGDKHWSRRHPEKLARGYIVVRGG